MLLLTYQDMLGASQTLTHLPLLCNPFDIFKFSFSGTYSFISTLVTPLKFIASHDLFIVRYSTKFCPGPTWTNPYLILVEDSLMKGLMKK